MKQFALILLIVTAFIAVVSRPVATNQLRGSEVEYATGLWDRELCLTRPQSNPRCPGWKPPICLSHPEMYICLPRRGSGLGRPARNFCDEETGRCTGLRPLVLCRDEPDDPGCLGRRNSTAKTKTPRDTDERNPCLGLKPGSRCGRRRKSTVGENVGPESADPPPPTTKKPPYVHRCRRRAVYGSTPTPAMWFAWIEFKKKFNKVYGSEEEEIDRRENYFDRYYRRHRYDVEVPGVEPELESDPEDRPDDDIPRCFHMLHPKVTAWRRFKELYNKVYESAQEEHDRQRTFFKNFRLENEFGKGDPPPDADEERS